MKAKTIVVLLTAVAGCYVYHNANTIHGNEIIETENRTLAPFEKIDVSGCFTINTSCQKEQKLSVTADQNLLPLIVTSVVNETLYIKVKNGSSISTTTDLKIDISVPAIKKINASGAIMITCQDIKDDSFGISMSGAVHAELFGTVETLNGEISGACTLKAANLTSNNVKICASGVSDIKIHAGKNLDIDISGSSNLCYHGNPAIVNQKISDVSKVTKN